MGQSIRYLMLFEAATFAVAALIHAGALTAGYQHPQARIAESVIASVLLVGTAAIWVRPAWTRRVALGAQGFALVGTLVGIFTIIVGIGPQSVPDIVYHVLIVLVLAWGLRLAGRVESRRSEIHG
jgi:steroid 5-alpha reductase family enzyme